MSELKSAWEIARGKADKLGKLSADELEQQREEKCRQIGQGIAGGYLDDIESFDLVTELAREPGEDKGLIRRAVLSRLMEAVDLGQGWGSSGGPAAAVETYRSGGACPRLEKIVQAIASLEAGLAPIVEQLAQLFGEYEAASTKARQEIETAGKETLHQLRISGTAVGNINIEARPQWQQAQDRLKEGFEPRLDKLKQELINTIA